MRDTSHDRPTAPTPLCAARRALEQATSDVSLHRPTDEQRTQVSTLARWRYDQGVSSRLLNRCEAQCDERHGQVKDYAECAALYGYVLGYWQARQEISTERAVLAS
jgi:hypothetical protein